MVSVAVSKLGKTDLVFVDPGAKINSVYYCNNNNNNNNNNSSMTLCFSH